MDFNHLHLYVDDATRWCDHFVQQWGGQAQTVDPAVMDHTALVCLGAVPLLLSAPHQPGDGVETYLRQHPLGLGDLAFWVADLDAALGRLVAQGETPLTPILEGEQGRWCQVRGWGGLRHTLVQSDRPMAWVPGVGTVASPSPHASPLPISYIDHGVINVPAGQMAAAADWYVQRCGFQPQQRFSIDTPWSGLRSQVLAHPQGGATLPINEPTTANSQIQEFLQWNHGPGVQHVALHTGDIVATVQRLKDLGVGFLEVPGGYYQTLSQRPGYGICPDEDLAAMQNPLADWERLEILVDWDDHTPQAKLLQTFTQPLFPLPTLFFEIIQRQKSWAGQRSIMAQGFGEHNFQALFEAMEQEQRKRGHLG